MSDMFRNAFRSRAESGGNQNIEYNPLGESLIHNEEEGDVDPGRSQESGVGESRPPLRSRMGSWGQSVREKFNNLMQGSTRSGSSGGSLFGSTQQSNTSSSMSGQTQASEPQQEEPAQAPRSPEEIKASMKELIESARVSSDLLNETTAGALRNPVEAVELADTIQYLAQVCSKLQRDITRLLSMEEALSDESLTMEALEVNDSLTRGLTSYTSLMGELPAANPAAGAQEAEAPPAPQAPQAVPDRWAPLGPAAPPPNAEQPPPPAPATDDDGWEHYDPEAFEAAANAAAAAAAAAAAGTTAQYEAPPPAPQQPFEPAYVAPAPVMEAPQQAAQPPPSEEDEEAMIARAIAESLKSEEERAAKATAAEQPLPMLNPPPAAPVPSNPAPLIDNIMDLPPVSSSAPVDPFAMMDQPAMDPFAPAAPLAAPPLYNMTGSSSSSAPLMAESSPLPAVQPNIINSLDNLAIDAGSSSSSTLPPIPASVLDSLPPPEQPTSVAALPLDQFSAPDEQQRQYGQSSSGPQNLLG